MCKKLTFLIAIVWVLGSAANASAELIGYWKLDEGSGNIAYDSGAGANDGTLRGGPQWVSGMIGGALEFDGSDDYVDCGNDPSLSINNQITVAAWIKTTSTAHAYFISKGITWDEEGHYAIGQEYNTPMTLQFEMAGSGGTVELDSNIAISDGEWHHIAGTYDNTVARIYIDGVEEGNTATPDRLTGSTVDGFTIGQRGSSNVMSGTIDEVRLYDQALAEPEIRAVMKGDEYPYAFSPEPEDGAFHADTWVTLRWLPGHGAASHDVYLGDNFDDVANGTGDTFRGNQTITYYVAGFPGFAYPEGLIPGEMYYWRIDEVNDADPKSPWRGEVWSFSIPPQTAYNPNPADGAEFVGPDNVILSWTQGFRAILNYIYFGDSYDEVSSATGGAPHGGASYNPGPLELGTVYYWRVDQFDGTGTYKGDVWNFTTPGAVGNPRPAYGAINVGLNAILSWTPSDSAASHELYFGMDMEAVRNADMGAPEYKGSKALGAESFDPGLLGADTTYYWRVDEVDSQGNVTKGPLWIFTTGAFLLIDDFEGYTDDEVGRQAIWQTWIDGFGIADNGAQVGYLVPPYAEQSIIHGGLQSMPLMYTNDAGVLNSEASMALSALRDWTQASVIELSLWFRGDSGNAAEPLYVAVSNSAGSPAVLANEDPSAATVRSWTQWRILLQVFSDYGINLTNVDKIAIGLGSKAGMASSGGSGTIYFDDIRLDQP